MNVPSSISQAEIRALYQAQGFVCLPCLFDEKELAALREVLTAFHSDWLQKEAVTYARGAINSAYLTDSAGMSAQDRQCLFGMIGDRRIARVLQAVFSEPAAFLNTQLFFNPKDSTQSNYWHRDIQYTGLPLDEQQAQLSRIQVIHLRLALRDEPGLELVPGTHRRWDTEEEFAVRMGLGRQTNDPLSGAQAVPLAAGDLLVFSANMLHRGLYGMNRLAFDMLFCDASPDLLQYARRSCLPSDEDLAGVACPRVFLRTRQVLDQAAL